MVLTLEWWPKRGRNTTGARTVPPSELPDEQWDLIQDLFVERPTGGRPRIAPRPCLEGILWLLRAGARWKDLPERFPSYPTCWRRLNEWVDEGVFQKAWARLLRRLDGLGEIDWDIMLGDATFSPAKKGAWRSARPSAAKAAS
jgi:transposase